MSEERKGELCMMASDILESFFPIITTLSFAYLPSITSLAWSTLFAAIFFGTLATLRGKLPELRNFEVWKYGLIVATILGVVFYSLIFTALQYTTAGNVSILLLFQVFTSYLFFNVFRGEPFSRERLVGSILLFVGAAVVLCRDFSGINPGDALILLSCCIAPIGNFFQRSSRNIASSEATLFARTLLSFPMLFIVAYFFAPHVGLDAVRASIIFLLLNGIVLFGVSKMLWIEAIHRISVTKASALYSVTPLLTLLLAWPLLGQVPNYYQFISLVPFFFGVLLLTDVLRFRRR